MTEMRFPFVVYSQGHEMGWLDARNLCRELCMDLVSIETPEENSAVAELIRERNLRSVWTSGRLCNFQGCNAPHLQPRHINGNNATQTLTLNLKTVNHFNIRDQILETNEH